MSGGEARETRSGRKRRIALRGGIALLAVLALVLLLLWFGRRGIADDFIAQELERRGVPARYQVEEIGFRRQRLTDVVIGDPADPDLVADWIEAETVVGLSGARVTGVRAGRVWLHGRLQGGTVSFGSIDKLLPPPSGKPFALPELFARVEDARMRLDTRYGAVGMKLAGEGRLNDGFGGMFAAVAPRLDGAGCAARDVALVGRLRIADGAPSFEGPVRGGALACDAVQARALRADLDVALDARFAAWRGSADVRLARLAADEARASGIAGTVDFAGDAGATQGALRIGARGFATPVAAGQGLALDGRYRIAQTIGFDGAVSAETARLSPATLAQVAALRTRGAGTPAAPLIDRLATALAAAGRDSAIDAQLAVMTGGEGGELSLSSLALDAESGARVRLAEGSTLRYRWPDAGLSFDGTLALSGGGLPEGTVQLTQAGPGAPLTGRATFAPYAAGDARLALTPVRFSAAPGGATRIDTRATFSGPLGDGRVDGLTIPVEARWDGFGRLAVNPGCVPAAFDRLRIASLTLDPARLRLCPVAGALVQVANGRVAGGAQIGRTRLTGRIGETPLTLDAARARFGLPRQDFALSGVATRIGTGSSATRIDAADVTGRIDRGVLAGQFSGAGGQIGQVPLLLSEAAGDWRMANGRLTLTGGLIVDDTAEPTRFETLASDDVRFTLEGNRIDATGTLRRPEGGPGLIDVTLTHDLGAGRGQAELDAQEIRFAEGELQPNDLTRLTLGVIAEVQGTLSGGGTIAWNGNEVTSTGKFRTKFADFAAAFGPVTGLSTEVEFGDLLGLATPEGRTQVATVALLNPGIPVENGVIRYRLLGGQRVAIEDGRWPFAGGELILEPTVLDFSQQREKRLLFRIVGADMAKFLQEMEFDNLNVTGVFDGELPIAFDASGGRIEGGTLSARGGGVIQYVGEVSQEDLGTWGNMAFQALRSLRYRNLDLELEGPLSGEMVSRIRFAGISQGEGAKSNFVIDRLQRLPFVFSVTIRAPFLRLADTVRGWYDPSQLLDRNLPQLLKDERREADKQAEADKSVQPKESDIVP